MPNATFSPIMAELKAATRAQHDVVEKLVDFGEALRDLAAYRQLLEKFYGFYAPVEQALGNVTGLEGAVPNLRSRMKTKLLAADLSDVGGEAGNVALCEALPSLKNVAEAIGCLYVLEGATLGGQILSRQAKDALKISAQYGGRFFSSYGQQVGHVEAILTGRQ